jgi:hypothetical protein
MAVPKSIPYILRHCTIAVFGRADTKGTGAARFKNAWNIARWALTAQGYLSPGSDTGPVDSIRLTSKGSLREQKHRREGRAKNELFDELYATLAAGDTTPSAAAGPVLGVTPAGVVVALASKKLTQVKAVAGREKKAGQPKAAKPKPKTKPKSRPVRAAKVKRVKRA